MAVVSLVLVFFSFWFVGAGLVPCFGWINWVAVPLSLLTAMSGMIGLFTDRDPDTLRMRGVAAHALALILGSILALLGFPLTDGPRILIERQLPSHEHSGIDLSRSRWNGLQNRGLRQARIDP